MPPDFFIGLDLGKERDYSAVAVVERLHETLNQRDPVTFDWLRRTTVTLRHAERIRLGTDYPDVVRRVAAIAQKLAHGNTRHIVADATGVGGPVVDILKRSGIQATITPVVITGADRESDAKGVFRVPKRDLIEGLQIMVQSGELQIAGRMSGLDAFLREMAAIRRWRSHTGHETYGARKNGEHDDLVLAVALACWRIRKMKPYDPKQPTDHRVVMG